MNYLSRPYQVEAPVQRGDLNIDFQVLNTLQNRYDANKSIVEQTLSKYEMLKGLRDSDNEYISAKISEMKAKIDSFGNKRLEHKSTVDGILSTARSVLDDPIIKDAVNSKAIKDQYDLQVGEVKKKGDGKYSDINYQYGLYKGGFYDYMQGKTNKLSGLTYVPYTDVTEVFQKKLKSLKDLKGKRYIEEVAKDSQGNTIPGLIVKKELDGLTDIEIQNYIKSTMTPEEAQQLKINGWAKYINNPTEAYNTFINKTQSEKDKHSSDIKVLSSKLDNTNLTTSEKNSIANQINLKKSIVENTPTNIEGIPLDEIAGSLEINQYVDFLADSAKAEWRISYDVNDWYYKEKDLEIKAEKLRLEIKAEKSGLEKERDKLPEAEDTTSSSPRRESVTINAMDSYKEEHDSYYNNILTTGRDLYNRILSEDDKKHFKDSLKSRGLDENLNWIDEKSSLSASKAPTIVAAFKDAGLQYNYSEYAMLLNDNLKKKQNIAKDLIDVEKQVLPAQFKQDPDGYIQALIVDVRRTFGTGDNFSKNFKIFYDFYRGITGDDTYFNTEQAEKEFRKYNIHNKEKFKKALLEKPENILAFNNVQKEIRGNLGKLEKSFGLFNPFLDEDVKEKTEDVLKNKRTSYFTEYDQVNFINTGVREQIIQKIPAENYGNNQDRLDPKLEFTVYKKGTSLVVEQYQGIQGSGKNKEEARTTVVLDNPEDAAYKEIQKYVDLEEKKVGLSAKTTSINIEPSKPKFANHLTDGNIVKSQVIALQNIVTNMGNNARVFSIDPSSFLTKEQTKKTFETNLKNFYDEDLAESFTNEYLNIVDKFTIQPITMNVKGTQTWGIHIKNHNNQTVFRDSIGLTELDNNLQYLIEYMPQVLISNYVFNSILTNKDNINTIINGAN